MKTFLNVLSKIFGILGLLGLSLIVLTRVFSANITVSVNGLLDLSLIIAMFAAAIMLELWRKYI